ncbi:hypothetical protein ACFE04_003324 [Oxalis oulophora]
MSHTQPPLSSSLLADDDTMNHRSRSPSIPHEKTCSVVASVVGAGGGGNRRLLIKMMKLLLDLFHRCNKITSTVSTCEIYCTFDETILVLIMNSCLMHAIVHSKILVAPQPIDATKQNLVGINSSSSNNYMRVDGLSRVPTLKKQLISTIKLYVTSRSQEVRKPGNVVVAGIPKTIDNDITAQRVINVTHVEVESIENGIGVVNLMDR